MTMAIGREAVITLYRNLLKESKKWSSYNYREYALRKVKHEFRQNKSITDTEKIVKCYENGINTLEMIKRQAILGNMYGTRPLIIESKKLNSDKIHSKLV